MTLQSDMPRTISLEVDVGRPAVKAHMRESVGVGLLPLRGFPYVQKPECSELESSLR